MKLSWAQQLSCCTCQGGAESADGFWGISCCQWWNHSLDPPWGYHVGLHSDIGRHMRCNAPQCPHGLLAFAWLTMLWKPAYGFLEPHTLGIPYAVGLCWKLIQHQPLCWIFIPLWVGHCLPPEWVETKFLIIHSGKWVLILCLHKHHFLDQLIQIQRVVRCACCIPIGILLHSALKQLRALTKDERECLPSVFHQ